MNNYILLDIEETQSLYLEFRKDLTEMIENCSPFSPITYKIKSTNFQTHARKIYYKRFPNTKVHELEMIFSNQCGNYVLKERGLTND